MKMRKICIKLMQDITNAIDNNTSDSIINEMIEELANNEEITNQEYTQIYSNIMLTKKVKFDF